MKRLGCVYLSLILLVGLLPLTANAANLEVEAKSALLMDVATGTVLYEQNSHERLSPASVTKVVGSICSFHRPTIRTAAAIANTPPKTLPKTNLNFCIKLPSLSISFCAEGIPAHSYHYTNPIILQIVKMSMNFTKKPP